MRKLIVSNIVSVDGYSEGPSKNVMDLFGYRFAAYPADESFDEYNAERLRAADTLLLGHATISQTMDTYSHVLPGMQDAAVSAMEGALS